MSEEKREEQIEEQPQCECGHTHGPNDCASTQEEQPRCECGHNHDYHGQHTGWRSHMIRRRMMMHFASITVEEEVEFLEGVKERLDGRLAIVNERLAKLKA